MKSYSPREVMKILEQNGWKLSRIIGSHYLFVKKNKRYTVAVPTSKKDIKIGTLKSIEKKTEIRFR